MKIRRFNENVDSIDKDTIESFFVELNDIGFQVTPVVETECIKLQIRYIESIYSNDTFKYSTISEPIDIFVDYLKELWGDVNVYYEYAYYFEDIVHAVEYGYSKRFPGEDINLVKIDVIIKKKEGIIKRIFKHIKKFEDYGN